MAGARVSDALSFPSPDRPRLRTWVAIALATLAWHALLIWLQPHWKLASTPPRVEVQQIDPKKLEAIRQQWRRRDREQQLLLNKDKNLPREKEAPPDARYMSDRNIRVAKEQQAKNVNVVPKARQPREAPEAAAKPTTEHVRKTLLGNLGVPMRLNEVSKMPKRNTSPARQARQAQAAEEGGDQAILDKNLPQGGENLLNAQESVYYSYYARLYEAIGPIWQSRIREVPQRRRVNQGEYSTVVDVICDSDGNLLEVHQERSSGVPEFDQAVQSSWRKIGRFPNPPTGLLNDRREVHTGWTFTVQVGPGFNVDYLPPERNY